MAYEEIIATATETYDDYDETVRQSYFGGPRDTIIEGLSPSEVNSDDFTVLFDIPGGDFIVGVDSISIEIFYEMSE